MKEKKNYLINYEPEKVKNWNNRRRYVCYVSEEGEKDYKNYLEQCKNNNIKPETRGRIFEQGLKALAKKSKK